MPVRTGGRVNAVEHYLEHKVQAGHSRRPAFRTAQVELTYGDLLEQVQRASRVLRETGVRHGDRVLLALPDCPMAVVFLLGAIGIGAVPAPIPPQMIEEEHVFISIDSEAAAAVVDETLAKRMLRIRASTGWPRVIFATGTEPVGDVVPIEAALAAAEPHELVLMSPDAMALIQYTSGSTGLPKGVVHLHRGLLALPQGFGQRLALAESDRCYSTAKLSFGYGLGNSVLFPLDAGASAVLRAKPSDPLGVLETIQTMAPTVVFAGPTLYRAIDAIRNVETAFDLSSVRLFVSAGDTLSATLFDRWRTRFDHEILDGLGSTECLHIFISGHVGALSPGRLGEVVDPYEVRLLDDDGHPAPMGKAGHLEVRGPATGACYWNRADRDEMRDDQGWIRTGDLLMSESDQGFRYIGRNDDVFKVRELKIAPIEIEEGLNIHPAVAESAVVGRPDEHGLMSVCAFVRLAPGTQADPALGALLRSSLRGLLAPHKVPRRIEFINELPRTNTGKLMRSRLPD